MTLPQCVYEVRPRKDKSGVKQKAADAHGGDENAFSCRRLKTDCLNESRFHTNLFYNCQQPRHLCHGTHRKRELCVLFRMRLNVQANMSGPNNGQNQQPRPRTKAEIVAQREQVRMLGIALGNRREAARQCGLSEGRVLNWVVR